MKKAAITLALLLVLVSLCGCKNEYHFDYEDLKEKVQKVEIVEYNSDTEEETLLSTISSSNQDQFLLDLSRLEYHFIWGTPIDPDGVCLKLIFKNGDSEIIGWCGTTKHKLILCNQEEFDTLVQNYLAN